MDLFSRIWILKTAGNTRRHWTVLLKWTRWVGNDFNPWSPAYQVAKSSGVQLISNWCIWPGQSPWRFDDPVSWTNIISIQPRSSFDCRVLAIRLLFDYNFTRVYWLRSKLLAAHPHVLMNGVIFFLFFYLIFFFFKFCVCRWIGLWVTWEINSS